MQDCWATDAKERPNIHSVLKRLQQQYKEHRSKSVTKANSAPPRVTASAAASLRGTPNPVYE